MNALPRFRSAATRGFSELVDETLSAPHMQTVAHPEDWPEPMAAAALPNAVWDHALGDIARDILGRPSRQFRARLCQLAWRLADGPGEAPRHLPAIVELVHAGSLIVDDIEDGSVERRGCPAVHVLHGLPRALNTGNWMYFWALTLIDGLDTPGSVRDHLRRSLSDTMYRCHLGQAIDLSIPVGQIPRGWMYRTVATSTMLKTGALMEFAARLGAVSARAADARVAALATFGRRLGLGLQMLDDFGNLTAPSAEGVGPKALEDLRNGRPTWPWAHAALELDEAAFSEWQAEVRLLGKGAEDESRTRALAAKLRMAVGLTGRRQAARYLDEALSNLRHALGERAELSLLADEIERLEASYG